MNPNKICIFYFSGTGNTKFISQLFCEEFIKKGAETKLIAIEEVLKGNINLNVNDYDIIGFGHPVHAFSAPRIYFDFLNHLPLVDDIPSFYFRTAGDPICNGGATSIIRKILQDKGYNVFHESLLVMPANVLFQYHAELTKQLIITAKRKIKNHIKGILQNEIKLQKNSLLLRTFSFLFSKMETLGGEYFGKYLYSTINCNYCNLCIQKCPTNNIYIDIEHRKIRFGKKCTFCMKCVYLCPRNAIKNKYLNFFILKDGYNLISTIENPNLEGKYITESTKGYFKHFYKYLTEI
jgi:ferredoxin/flavodoxin